MRRNTWQREAVRAALRESDGFIAAQPLHQRLRDGGSPIGLATVYRALADLADTGEADALAQDGESLFRACESPRHHHHLICRMCGRTVEVEADGVEEWARAVASVNGYTEPSHTIDVFGLCPVCSAKTD